MPFLWHPFFSMLWGRLCVVVFLWFVSSITAWSASITLSLDPNSEPDITGYKIYYETTNQLQVIDVGLETTARIPDLIEGWTYLIYATAYNTAGLESEPSVPISYTVPLAGLAPVITGEPVARVVPLGGRAEFIVTATGPEPLHYEWLRDGEPIPDTDGPTLLINPVLIEDAGLYAVRVSNAYGSDTSQEASLQLLFGPTITLQPVGTAIQEGDSIEFRVAAAGDPPLGYQWYRNGSPLPGQSGTVLRIPSATAADAGNYRVRVSNLGGSIFSDTITLTIVPPPLTLRASLVSGSLLISADAIPGNAYSLESRDQIETPWTLLDTIVVNASGEFRVEVPLDSAVARFFRTVPADQP